jgi:hypothetical protein
MVVFGNKAPVLNSSNAIEGFKYGIHFRGNLGAGMNRAADGKHMPNSMGKSIAFLLIPSSLKTKMSESGCGYSVGHPILADMVNRVEDYPLWNAVWPTPLCAFRRTGEEGRKKYVLNDSPVRMYVC